MNRTIGFLTTLRVFVPFAAGYFLSYLYRVVNAVIAADLVGDLGIGPSSLGLLTSTYFIAFASFQLPLGVLLDRYGPRRMEAMLLLFAGLGAYLFSRSGTLAGLVVARAFIGFGVSACLMAAFKAYTLWFAREKWPLVNGFQMAAGGFGALAATAPVEAALHVTDWRGVFMVLAVLTLVVAVAVYIVVPEKRSGGNTESLRDQLKGVRTVFTSRAFWRVAPLTTMSQASFLSIQGLWAGPWLKDVAGLERMAVAHVLFWVAVAMIAGFILLGSLAGRLSRSGISVLTTSVTGMGLFMGVQLVVVAWGAAGPVLPLWLLFGFFGTSGILAYAALSQSFPVQLSGRVTTAVNLLVFVAAFLWQWAIGAMIGIFPVSADGSYALAGYRTGFSIMLGIQALTVVWFLVAGRMGKLRAAQRID
ncbi:MFS transporter [Desulfosarcina alkanivorans]|uniref:MFS transporter n=1 Tax=Desulfosarcina alkanivorans TaxID=571177 RepID=A0A5K7YGN7_9BACT|nr:MFS transporter [Desulfosarcina alkanivorans]BBO68762.1 MFS transporter [Desulfosarcina alkanivorans]